MKPTAIIIHHELGNNGFNGVNDYHEQLWHFKSSLGYYIGYQVYISTDGKVYQGRKDDEEGAHCIGRNLDSIGICLEGNGDLEKPNPVQLAALKAVVLEKMTKWAIIPSNVFSHRTYAPYKSCPGNLWKESEIRELLNPDVSYYQSILNSLKDLLLNLQRRRFGSTVSACIDENSKG